MPWSYRKKLTDFMTAVSDNSEGEVWIYGDIVDDAWWDNEVSPVVIRDTLNEMGPVGTLNIRVNSYGGSVYAGNAIINILDGYRRKTGAKINAYIEGIAASMGSGIPMVADKIYMAENAMYMLHKPFTIVVGNSKDLENEIEVLEKAEETLIANYMRHFNGTEDELKDLLANETWLTAKEAIDYGLCDEIVSAVTVAASAKGGVYINGKEFLRDADKIVAKFGAGSPIAKINPKEEIHVFEYDKRLQDYGIDAETFKLFGMEAATALTVLENAAVPVAVPDDNGQQYLTANAVKDALGEEMDSDRLITLAKAGMEIDPSMSEKAKAYDKLVNDAIEAALKNGYKAKGDNFNEAKWKKILSSLNYDEIIDQSSEWLEDAKIALHAGKRVSEPWKGGDKLDSGLINPDDYDFVI